jgi:Leucine-rich repeat (LRR) protein
LKFILLDNSPKLIETPDFTEVPNLEKLILKNCINLREVHPSIGVHRKLILLDLEGCKNLKTLPSRFEMESLKILNLSGCSKVKKIPEFGRNMERVYLDGTAIIELPTSIEHLNGLTNFLNLRNCKNLVCLPNSIFNSKLLKYVDISGCSKLESLPENLGNAESIEELDVSGTAIRQVPSSICLLKNLKELSLRGCNGLSCKSWYELLYSTPVGLPPLLGLHSLIKLDLRDCKLKKIPNGIGSLFSLRDLDLCGNDFICLPEIDGLSNLETLWLDYCKNLQSLPKLPSNVWDVGARVCSSLQMLLDQLKVTRYLHFDDCFKMTSNQGFIDMYIAMIKNYHQVSL